MPSCHPSLHTHSRCGHRYSRTEPFGQPCGCRRGQHLHLWGAGLLDRVQHFRGQDRQQPHAGLDHHRGCSAERKRWRLCVVSDMPGLQCCEPGLGVNGSVCSFPCALLVAIPHPSRYDRRHHQRDHRYLYRSDPQGHDGSAIYSGLIGPILVTAKGKGVNAAEGRLRPKTVDKEFINIFLISDENNSPYVNNLRTGIGLQTKTDPTPAGHGYCLVSM